MEKKKEEHYLKIPREAASLEWVENFNARQCHHLGVARERHRSD